MSALVEGALKGFNMMERHHARINGEKRQTELDNRNNRRYEEQQIRQAELDNRSEDRYQEQKTFREQQAEDTLEFRKKSQENAKDAQDWRQKFQADTQQWKEDQQMIGSAWQYFRSNGQVAPEHEEMLSRNAGYDPRTFRKPEYREAVKGLGMKMESAIKTGKISEVNNPETIKLFDTVFKNKFSSSIGSFDYAVGKKIKDVSFAGFAPVEGKENMVTFGLKVTYDDGSTQVKPMTKGRSTDKGDPVLQMSPKELIKTIQSKMTMADMIERPEYWDEMGAQFLPQGVKNQQVSQAKAHQKAKIDLRREVNSLNKELRKIDSDEENQDLTPEQLQEKRKPILNAINGAYQHYGVENPSARTTIQPSESIKAPPIDRLSEGKPTKFKNGQVWILENGKAKQLSEG